MSSFVFPAVSEVRCEAFVARFIFLFSPVECLLYIWWSAVRSMQPSIAAWPFLLHLGTALMTVNLRIHASNENTFLLQLSVFAVFQELNMENGVPAQKKVFYGSLHEKIHCNQVTYDQHTG